MLGTEKGNEKEFYGIRGKKEQERNLSSLGFPFS